MTTPPAREGQGQARRAASSLVTALGVLLLPKCPLCIAAYLTSLGLSAGAAAIAAPLLRPTVVALAFVALLWLLIGWWRKRGAQHGLLNNHARAGCAANCWAGGSAGDCSQKEPRKLT